MALHATIVALSNQSLREVKDHFSEVVDRVEQERERVRSPATAVPPP